MAGFVLRGCSCGTEQDMTYNHTRKRTSHSHRYQTIEERHRRHAPVTRESQIHENDGEDDCADDERMQDTRMLVEVLGLDDFRTC